MELKLLDEGSLMRDIDIGRESTFELLKGDPRRDGAQPT
jgi:hypothetical protein